MGVAPNPRHGSPVSLTSFPKIALTTLTCQLTSTVPLDPRPEYHRVQIRPTPSGLMAFSTGGQRSSRTVSLAGANGLLELPASKDGDVERKEGEVVQCVLIGELGAATT